MSEKERTYINICDDLCVLSTPIFYLSDRLFEVTETTLESIKNDENSLLILSEAYAECQNLSAILFDYALKLDKLKEKYINSLNQ